MNKFRGVILDIDGTLIDSNAAHARAWVDALAEEGIQVPFEKVRPLIGMGGDKLLPAGPYIGIELGRGRFLRPLCYYQDRKFPVLSLYATDRATRPEWLAANPTPG